LWEADAVGPSKEQSVMSACLSPWRQLLPLLLQLRRKRAVSLYKTAEKKKLRRPRAQAWRCHSSIIHRVTYYTSDFMSDSYMAAIH